MKHFWGDWCSALHEDELNAHLFGWFGCFFLLPRPKLHVKVTELSRKRQIYHLYIIRLSSVVKYLHVMGGQAYRSRWEATRALQNINDSQSDSQVDNGSGWCLLCLWMERLHFPWLWAAIALKKCFIRLEILRYCFLNASLKICSDLCSSAP